eukprot:TRINITY_DN81857_c0_g1_i1.p1 TRINITY_DN81857_c0_g1~~TRINITY_DN81857_c0_g1_i1.p1  ORF type:complete len:363 (+),score=72.31 TRINITY_DN81857_c0_g1_i1:56-1144(+)
MSDGVGMAQEEGSNDLLQAHAHVWNLTFSFISSMSLKCAIQLGIPDIIHNHGQPITLSELAASIPITPTKTAFLQRLMRLLVHSGIFAIQKNEENKVEKEQGYVLTPSSKILLSTRTGVSPFLLMMTDSVLVLPWHFLSSWFIGNEPTAFETAHGTSLWGYTANHPEHNNLFNKAMASDTQLVMSIIVKELASVFHGLRSLVDVGGGTGTAATIIAEAFPQVKCTVFDLPHVVETLPKDSIIHAVGGDMFESIPHADAVFLKWLLHACSDEECVKILRRCKEAIPSKEEGGKVIILEMVLNANKDHKPMETQLYFDVLMLVNTKGREREEHEWRKIFMDAGFDDYKISPVLGLRSLIEVYPS